jgi:hypothetical protein
MDKFTDYVVFAEEEQIHVVFYLIKEIVTYFEWIKSSSNYKLNTYQYCYKYL